MEDLLKIAIIHGSGNEREIEGTIDYITCPLDDEKIHIALMLDYLKEHYKSDQTLQKCTIRTSINSIAMYLSLKGDIVFMNTTSYKPNILQKHGTSGIITMPCNLNEKQYNAVIQLRDKIKEFNEIQIWYDIRNDGNANIKIGSIDVLDKYLNSIYEDKDVRKFK